MSARFGLVRTLGLTVLLATVVVTPIAAQPALLKVSDNKRFLVTADGRPFFWLGDTAWELFHRPTREDVHRYLRKRAEQRFTVIQAVALAEFDGLNEPNAYGHRPLVNNDPTTPDVKDGPDNDYWDHVDFVVRQAGIARALRRVPADVGRQVERQSRRRARDLHGAERRGLRRVAGPALQGHPEHHLDPRRRPRDRDRHAPRDHPGDGARPPRRRRRRAPDDVPSPGRQQLVDVVP